MITQFLKFLLQEIRKKAALFLRTNVEVHLETGGSLRALPAEQFASPHTATLPGSQGYRDLTANALIQQHLNLIKTSFTEGLGTRHSDQQRLLGPQ